MDWLEYLAVQGILKSLLQYVNHWQYVNEPKITLDSNLFLFYHKDMCLNMTTYNLSNCNPHTLTEQN